MVRDYRCQIQSQKFGGIIIQLLLMPVVIVQLRGTVQHSESFGCCVPLASLHKPFSNAVMQTADLSVL